MHGLGDARGGDVDPSVHPHDPQPCRPWQSIRRLPTSTLSRSRSWRGRTEARFIGVATTTRRGALAEDVVPRRQVRDFPQGPAPDEFVATEVVAAYLVMGGAQVAKFADYAKRWRPPSGSLATAPGPPPISVEIGKEFRLDRTPNGHSE